MHIYYKPRRRRGAHRASREHNRAAWRPPPTRNEGVRKILSQEHLPPGALARGETGYPWFSFSWPTNWSRLGITAGVVSLAVATYVLYLRIKLPAEPASLPGLGYALVGTGCFLCALCGYRACRRARPTSRLGYLHTRLEWHYSYAILALALLTLHSFGHMDPHLSGTYAGLSLLGLVGSGYLGRALDHLLPRLAAMEMNRALAGEADVLALTTPAVNLAPLLGPIRQLRDPARPASDADAMRRVTFYRSLRACWRRCHIALAGLACILTVWHLAFVTWLFLTGRLFIP
jgi:hypothetical protein